MALYCEKTVAATFTFSRVSGPLASSTILRISGRRSSSRKASV
jgi:hypothetical protein